MTNNKGTGAQELALPQAIAGPVKRWNLLLSLFSLAMAVGWYLGLGWIGADKDQGDVFRIMFVHVPVAWCAFFWVITGAVFAVWGFVRPAQAEACDRSSHAATELGTIFAALALITGSIWGRPTWGVWWDWDPRLTSTLVLFLICCGYLILRSFTPDIKARRNVAGITSILSAINVPIVYFSVNLWRSLHQPQTFVRKNSTASSDVGTVLFINVAVMVLVSLALYKIRRQSIAAAETLESARESQ